MDDVRLHVVHQVAVDDLGERPLAEQPLAGGLRHASLAAEPFKGVDILRRCRLLEKEDVQFFHPASHVGSLRQCQPPVGIDHDVHPFADGVADGTDALDLEGNRRRQRHYPVLVDPVRGHFQSVEPGFDHLPGVPGDPGGGVAGNVGVKANAVAAGAAEELIDRHAERLALDVPEGDLDGANGAGQHRAAPPARAAIHRLPQAFDAGGVLADQVARQRLDGAGDGRLLAGHMALTESGDPGVSVDFDEHPVAGNRVVGAGDANNEGL